MRAFLAVLWREMAERWLIAVAAAVLSLVPLAAPLLEVPGYRGPDLRGGVALGLSLIVSLLLALMLGSSILARDLGERRLGFYFSRPLPGLAIWGGKLAAAFLLALGSGLLVGLPAVLLGDGVDLSGYWGTSFSLRLGLAANLGLWAAALALLVLLANAVSTMIRTRSPWLLLDLAAATLLAAFLWVESNRLLAAQAVDAFFGAGLGLLIAGVVALAAATAVQVVRGRTDARLGHRLLSLTLWGLLGVSALAAAGFGRWVLAASPKDLTHVLYVDPAPAGDWVTLSGIAQGRAGFQPTFLFDTRSGAYARIPGANWLYGVWDGAVFSADGRRAVWLEREGGDPFPLHVRRLDLDRPGARPVSLQVAFDAGYPKDLVVSPDGRRFAALHRGRVLAWELDTGRALLSIPIPPGFDAGQQILRFLPSGNLRFYALRRASLSLAGRETRNSILAADIDPGTGRVARSRNLPVDAGWMTAVSPDGDRILVEQRTMTAPLELRVVDLATSTVVSRTGTKGTLTRAAFLRDGRLVIWSRRDRDATVLLLDHRGVEVRRFMMKAERLGVAAQPAPGRLVLAYAPPKRDGKERALRSAVLDLDRGSLKILGEGLVAVGSPGLTPGSPGTRLFWQDGGGLVEVDPTTGRRRVILKQKGSKQDESREERWGKGS